MTQAFNPLCSLEAMNSAPPPLPHGLSHVEALNEEFSFEDEKLTIEELRHQLLHEGTISTLRVLQHVTPHSHTVCLCAFELSPMTF